MNNLYVPKLQQLPADMLSLADYERRAPEFIPHPIFEYIDGGCGNDITRHSNTSAFDRWKILPRQLRDFRSASLQTQWLQNTLACPIGIAPVAYQKLVHPDGEIATAKAADALGSLFLTSTLSSTSVEDIAAATKQHWFQLYWQKNREHSLQLMQRAEAAGAQAIVLTVDAPVNGLRQRAQRANFQLPSQIRAVNLPEQAAHTKMLEPHQSPILHGAMANAPTWEDVRWLRQQTQLPLIIKGILSPLDAKLAQDYGANGVIVSNHGGRTIDGVPNSIDMLSAVRNAIDKDMLILLDSGVRRGSDVFKALALGANGVLLGRPIFYGLAIAGALGVAHTLKLLQEELEMTMALAGCPTLEDITHNCLIPS